MLVTDFDKTLVNQKFEISTPVKQAIKRIIDKGYAVCIATGRPYRGLIEKTCRLLNLTAPQIVSGGAQIIDPTDGNSLWEEYFSKESVEKIIKFFLDCGWYFSVESQGFVFSNAEVNLLKGYGPGIKFKSLDKLNLNKVLKMVLLNPDITIDMNKVENQLNNNYPELHAIKSGYDRIVLDITSQKATKHLAVLEISKLLNIKPSLMVGVGDGYNDYPLLSVCGYKAAMSNAPDELKKIADVILPDVNHNGLVTLIDKLQL